MADISPYTLARERAERDLRASEQETERLRRLVADLKAQEAQEQGKPIENSPPGPSRLKDRALARRRRMARPKVKPRQGEGTSPFGPPVNPDGQSWTEAIAEVLQDGKARTVAEVVEDLTEKGRQFGKSRPDALVRQALRRGEKRKLWSQHGRPARWKIAK